MTKNANPKATIEDRKNKGNGILSKMHALLQDIPLGSKRLEIGLTLREAWFVNGTLFNSEVWSAYTNNDIKVLELLDRKILRLILGAQGKVPCEMLYLETGALELNHVIAVRRIVYLQKILKKHESEIIKKIYNAQKKSPCYGDWVLLVEADKIKYEIEYTDEKISQIPDEEFKKYVKNKVRQYAFKELKEIQSDHEKVKDIEFESLKEPQNYLKDKRFNNKISSLLLNLRCQSVNGIKGNFRKLYEGNLECQLKCNTKIETQEHITQCHELIKHLNPEQKKLLDSVQYCDLFGNTSKQLNITKLFKTLLGIRERLLGNPRSRPATARIVDPVASTCLS